MNKMKKVLVILLAVAIGMNSGVSGLAASSFDVTEAQSETVLQTDPVADTAETPAEEPETPPAETTSPATETETTESTETETMEQTETETTEQTETTDQTESETMDQTETETTDETETETSTDEIEHPAFKDEYKDGDVVVRVAADEGALPEGVEMKVIPVVKKETKGLPAEQKAEQEKINQMYDKTADLLEKDTEEDEEIQAFLAYDISFMFEGEEIEPKSEVKVEWDFVNPVRPEGVSEDAEIVVNHLEEKDGKVEVKDITGAAKVETQGDRVAKVEFASDSFSTFTIKWANSDGNVIRVSYEIYDENNNLVEANLENPKVPDGSEIKADNGDWVELDGYADNIIKIDGVNYVYLGAFLIDEKESPWWYTNKDGTAVDSVRYYNGSCYYKNSVTNASGRESIRKNGEEWDTTKKIRLVYVKELPEPGEDGGSTPGLEAPDHNKTIKKNKDGDYKLSLDVTGEVGQTVPIDILLIVDTSQSMSGQGITNLNSALQTLLNTLKHAGTEGTDISLAAVRFSKTAKDGISGSGGWRDPVILGNWVKLQDIKEDEFRVKEASEGTNWQAGVSRGEGMLNDPNRTNNKKYVLFITDGNPTYRLNSTGSNSLGSGRDDPNRGHFNAAVREWEDSPNLRTATTFVIDANSDSDSRCQEFSTLIHAAETFRTSEKDDMDTAFAGIASAITTPAYTDVVITDVLSEYADFAFRELDEGATEHPDIEVYSQSVDGNDRVRLKEHEHYEVKINYIEKSVSVTLLKGEPLVEGTKYSVEFDIVPSQEAIDYRMEGKDYPRTGETSTDAPDNIPPTSAGKDGFYSNAVTIDPETKEEKSKAKVTYKVNKMSGVAEYNHPVIQVDEIDRSVKKIWKGISQDDEPNLKATMNLTARVWEDGDWKILYAGKFPQATMTSSGGWTHTWEKLPKYYYGFAEGERRLTGIEIQYIVSEETVPGFVSSTPAPDDQDNSEVTEVVNTKEADWVLIKKSASNGESEDQQALKGAKFTMVRSDDLTYKGISGEDGVVTWTDSNGAPILTKAIEAGQYTLKEIEAPKGYATSGEWTLTFGSKGALPEIKKGKDPIHPNSSEKNNDGVMIHTYIFENSPAYELPETGGIGTYLFTISGVAILMSALLLFISTYRRKGGVRVR